MKKGYFVRGEFITEGSARDLELKAELKGSSEQSRTELKHQADELQKLGISLLTLRPELSEHLALPAQLKDALAQARRISDFSGRRRQLQFIGKLMRRLDPEVLLGLRGAVAAQGNLHAAESLALHQAELWRDRLLVDDAALVHWTQLQPKTDRQQLRSLIRQARKDAGAQAPAALARHTRAYREIFQLLHGALVTLADNDATASSIALHREAS